MSRVCSPSKPPPASTFLEQQLMCRCLREVIHRCTRCTPERPQIWATVTNQMAKRAKHPTLSALLVYADTLLLGGVLVIRADTTEKRIRSTVRRVPQIKHPHGHPTFSPSASGRCGVRNSACAFVCLFLCASPPMQCVGGSSGRAAGVRVLPSDTTDWHSMVSGRPLTALNIMRA